MDNRLSVGEQASAGPRTDVSIVVAPERDCRASPLRRVLDFVVPLVLVGDGSQRQFGASRLWFGRLAARRYDALPWRVKLRYLASASRIERRSAAASL